VLLARIRIRGKLALLAAIPLLAVAGLTAPLVVNQVDVANRAGDIASSVRVASGVGSLVQDLQQERLLAAGYLLRVADQADLAEQTARVTDRITELRADLGGELSAELRAAIEGVRDLGPVRTQVLARAMSPEQAVAAFNPMIARLIQGLHLGEQVDLTASSNREVVALAAVLRLNEGINTGAAYLVVAATTGSPVAIGLLGATLTTINVLVERFSTYATPEQYALYALLQEAFDARAGKNFLAGYAVDPVRTIASITVPALFPSMLSFITLCRFVERKIATEVTAKVAGEQRRALGFAYGAAALSILVLLLVLVLSIAVAGAVARPLTRLTRSAERVARVAEEELERVADEESDPAAPIPLAPIDIRASMGGVAEIATAQDEVGDLARAFERVQLTAARLVERQVASRRNVAQMFGHVGRRTQNLVGRQIALIDQLERGEEDPGRLQYLYRLDHLSSRLRRNAGSLVVLSGAAGGQPHVEPMQLANVVRLALGEIEDYTRVDLAVPDDLALVPAIVGDMVLVLAELMENATAFSPPHTRVTVSTARSATGTGARLTIVDRGLGLSPERLAEENARLSRRERLDLAPTEVLGLFVVGRLARRHGLGVTLSATPGGGVTATVELARHMLVPVRGQAEPTRLDLEPATASAQTLALPAPARPPAARHLAPAQPSADRRPALPAAGAPARPMQLATRPAFAGRELPFDVAALDRASRTLEAGPTWNAFATQERLALPPRSSPPPAEAPPAEAPATDLPPTDLPATDLPATDLPAPVPRPVLRQRIRGAQLPAGASPQPAGPAPLSVDPESARTLVEQFEAGVRRALSEAADTVPAVPAAPAATPLTRRVPGATLDSPLSEHGDRPPPQHRPPDPEQVRDLVEQFEAGVSRALREVAPDHRQEKEEEPP
jgi:signal transduction histidine kinase